MTRVYNFSPGPATLPDEVLQSIRDELLDYQNSGMSVMEMSHRGKHFQEIYNESIRLLRKVASIPDRFDILYMSGGASTQFVLVPQNLSSLGRKAGYVNTGSWSKKAIAQAQLKGIDVHICASSEAENFRSIPEHFDIPEGLDYVHITSNNTIFGTQFHKLPSPSDSKLVIDMSSDFLSHPIDWKNINMIYAGAQKNAGPAGVTIVIIDRSLYGRESEKTAPIFRYSNSAKNKSCYNTPPTFQIYVFMLMLRWLESRGGLSAIEKFNKEKAELIYEQIRTNSDIYEAHALPSSQSLMNVTFTLKDGSKTENFLMGAEKKNLLGLKGHRSVGGLRASIYNSMKKEGCQALADYMAEFASTR